MNIGKTAAYLHWQVGLSWNAVTEILEVERERARSAARKYADGEGIPVGEPKPQVTESAEGNEVTGGGNDGEA